MEDSMDRQAAHSGTFYPGSAEEIRSMVAGLKSVDRAKSKAIGAMVPHAGYIYSGGVAKSVIASVEITPTVVILCPCHVIAANAFGIWPDGKWETPLGAVNVDERLAAHLMDKVAVLEKDYRSHAQEHSLEVIIPFIQIYSPESRIVPISVGTHDADKLISFGKLLADALEGDDVLVIASSDMTHFETAETAERMDDMALDCLLKLDARSLADTVRRNGISMCGVAPVTAMTEFSVQRGATKAELVHYTNSAEATGDAASVVAYAGVVIS